MTKERVPEECIEEFVSEGPKDYAYRTVNAKTLETKVVAR